VSGEHTVLVSKLQSRVPIESVATPIFAPEGALLGCVLVFRDVSERFLVQDRLQWQAGHDSLTGLPNRALLADRFERAMEKARRDSTHLAVCLLDLDNFKPVNDRHGHAAGDALLVAMTARLLQGLRGVDTLSRLGGDEFVILLEELDPQADLPHLLQRLLEILARPFDIQGQSLGITASLGYTVFPQDNADPDTLLRHVDQAMYVAKQTGRNRFHRFDLALDRERESAHQTVQRVQQAITQDELRLYYQPKVNLRTGEVQGFEALLRWQHPQDGMIPPMAFLPILEQSDVIVAVGEWVIEAALKQLRLWAAQGQQWPVSVNIAARHFLHADFLPRLNILLASYADVAPSWLEFEVLESVSLGDVQTINAIILACRSLGIGFSLDDFGTGYSSLSYLKRIPVQTIKIDQSFVRDMLDDRDDRALVQSIIHIASLFKLKVIAEGVETQEQGALLMRMGCDVVQGYGIARPMPAAETFDWACSYPLAPPWHKLSTEVPYHPRPRTSDFTPLN
jgi:diguanylate cyclase (GGDEF)-like protein